MVKKFAKTVLPTGNCHAFDSPANPLHRQYLADCGCVIGTRDYSLPVPGWTLSKKGLVDVLI
jgi:hypothetical protein